MCYFFTYTRINSKSIQVLRPFKSLLQCYYHLRSSISNIFYNRENIQPKMILLCYHFLNYFFGRIIVMGQEKLMSKTTRGYRNLKLDWLFYQQF